METPDAANTRPVVTFDDLATAYMQDYELQGYRTLDSAKGRVANLRKVFGEQPLTAITPAAIRQYQVTRRQQGLSAATVNRETSGLSRMFRLAIELGKLDDMPRFPQRLGENPPRQGFFEHGEYLKVRAHLPASFQDILDFAYYSGWRRREVTDLTWDEVDLAGGGSPRPHSVEDQGRTAVAHLDTAKGGPRSTRHTSKQVGRPRL